MAAELTQEALRRIPPITELLKSPRVAEWLKEQPPAVVTDCLRRAAASVREALRSNGLEAGRAEELTGRIISLAAELLELAVSPRLQEAINAQNLTIEKLSTLPASFSTRAWDGLCSPGQ